MRLRTLHWGCSRDSPRKVWSMEDDRQVRALALLDYVESKQIAAIVRGKLSEFGELLKVAGEELKTDPFMYLAKRYTLPPQSEIDALTNQLAELEETVEQMRKKAADYGVSV